MSSSLKIEDRFYKINRICLKFLGIWPYQNSTKWTRVQTTIIRCMYLSGIFIQLGVFITHECNLDILVDVLSFTFPAIFILLMYSIFYYNIDTFKELFESIYHDWKIFNTKAELAIINDYANTVKLFTQFFSTFTCIAMIVTTMIHVIPITLDMILPLNESREQGTHLMVEYFIDPSKYHILIVSHLTLYICLGAIGVMAIALTFLSFGFHSCALLKLTNYHVKIMMDQTVLQTPSPRKEQVIYERIVFAIAVHRRALQFCKQFVLSLETWFFVITIIGVLSLSINIFRMLKAITVYNSAIDVFIPCVLVFVHFCFMFFGNQIGQNITDHTTDIFNTIYQLPWYTANLNIQKLLLFLLLKGSKTFYVTLDGLIKVSYECFTTLTTSSISYFTVIYSFQ
ncbi:hypothetical protein DMN91_009871 [Ooceraea biroi]|uniref:Odorant receptor n=1 Tax=Ooceraea biroi TaxID=2015173 RepID=A0A026VXR0_OOCBI|nr:uncharacterized protein LOC105285743 isoform X2 [Ooceraea biroi]EZA48246.1 hypothetical protein X777_14145 [Ooceraea biroi]RLU17635.1 hypothetical protein DMN91_009871 [Ooceraea biroi]